MLTISPGPACKLYGRGFTGLHSGVQEGHGELPAPRGSNLDPHDVGRDVGHVHVQAGNIWPKLWLRRALLGELVLLGTICTHKTSFSHA